MPKFTPKMKIKKIALVLSATIAMLGIGGIALVRADTTAAAASGSDTIYLQQIAAYTNSILTAITTPANPMLVMILETLLPLSAPDNSTNPPSPTPTLQNLFSNLNFSSQAIEQLGMLTNFMGIQSDMFSGISTASVPNVNDLSYGTLMGLPPVSPDPRGKNAGNPVYNYVKMAAGVNITATAPGTDWKGSTYDQTNYRNYFNAITAVQSFNAYALSQIYADTTAQLSTQQSALVAQASDPKSWFAIVASEPIGAVVRQILVFESQNYVVLTELLQTQKLLLATAAMNNTVQMANGMSNSTLLITKATTAMPKTGGGY
jgi:hypothetical protein